MRYTVKLKDKTETLTIEADDVGVDCCFADIGGDRDNTAPAVFYFNFIIGRDSEDPTTVAAIPFDSVFYVARL